MKVLVLLISTLPFFAFSQTDRVWDISIGAMDSDEEGFASFYVPNVNIYFGILGQGEWHFNTGVSGTQYLSDIDPEFEVNFPCKLYAGFNPPKDSLDYWEEDCREGRYKEVYIPVDSSAQIELTHSVTFEKNELIIKNLEDIQDIIYFLKKDDKNEVFLGHLFNVQNKWKHEDLMNDRINFIKSEVAKYSQNLDNRISVVPKIVTEKHFISDQVPVEFRENRTEAYLHSENTIICSAPLLVKFHPLADTMDKNSFNKLNSLPEFLLKNSGLRIQVNLYRSANINAQLIQKRFETINKVFVNSGISPNRIVPNIRDFYTKSALDSMLLQNQEMPDENEIHFLVLAPDSIPPCGNSGHPKIHFKKYRQEIFETECDSLNHLVEIINSNTTSNYYLIGIATDKTPEERFNAKSRAEIVKDRLIRLGINPNRLTVTQAHHKAPLEGKPKNWPFYPDWYEFEIGVYLEIDN